jgi:hypothetical protein
MALFELYRRFLFAALFAYTVLQMGRLAANWVATRRGSRGSRLFATYVEYQLARVKLRRFRRDLLEVVLLGIVLAVVLSWHPQGNGTLTLR